MDFDDPASRIEHLTSLEKLSDTLADRDGGELFQRDLAEARELAARDARFEPLVAGLAATSLGERMAAIDAFFRTLDPAELAAMPLPVHLAQLRQIFLSSR